VDLAGYLERRAEPDRRLQSEAALVDRVGAWIGQQVLGPIAAAIVERAPVVVRVQVPTDAEVLLYRPLELAYVGGVPLARQDVSLVWEVAGEARGAVKDPIGGRLRLLAVFSLPTATSALAIRRERYDLTRLVRQIATRRGRAVELHVLQYGTTRQRLREVLEEGDGWDLVHFSGHGLAGALVLEHADGTPDPIPTPELVGLLRPARRQLKLVVLSSCQSAAAPTVEVRRWLRLPVPDQLQQTVQPTVPPLPALARELVRSLDCAVVAMRYPVVDDFAIALSAQLYDRLLGHRQPLTRALQRALPEAAGEAPSPGAPAVSVATPALFGPLAADLQVAPPQGGPQDFNVGTLKLAAFPPEPARFVGRTGPMANASAVLAPQNRQTAVLFSGMAGAGKTACALELAYRHEQAFEALCWWQAPEVGHDIAPALTDVALVLEDQLPGLAMVQAIGDERDLSRFLPRLVELLEQRAILLVLDNLESLLTDQGRWRDPRWGPLVDALTSHGGESRVVLTSRIAPHGLSSAVLALPVHALSLDEALLLARELPNLGRLLRGHPSGDGRLSVEQGRALVRRVLAVVQGHPGLLELADAKAADPAVLASSLEEADRAASVEERDRLAAFFEEGTTALPEEHFVRVLADWTNSAAAALPEGPVTLFQLLCCLEEPDRWQEIVKHTFPQVWRRLGRTGDPPTLRSALGPLVSQGLVEVQGTGEATRYRLHPGVAEAGRKRAGAAIQQAVDTELAGFWREGFRQAGNGEGRELGPLLVRTGLSAAPYLMRLRDWVAAGRLLEHVIVRDHSPRTVQAVLPLQRQIAEAVRGTDRELLEAGALARLVGFLQPKVAIAQIRDLLDRALQQERFDLATASSGDLANLLQDTGQLKDALEVVERKAEFTRRAGFGPWTQLAARGQRVQLLLEVGRVKEALEEVEQLRGEMAAMPETNPQAERVTPWSVREGILHLGQRAAQLLQLPEDALALNAETLQSMLRRDATDYEIARVRFNDYEPLLRLDRLRDVEGLLLACRKVFQAEGDVRLLGRVLSALAHLEDTRNYVDDAISLEQTALRYAYAAGDPQGIAVSHFKLARYLERAEQAPAAVLSHRLGAALLSFQIGSGSLVSQLQVLVGDLARLGATAPLPTSFADLCEQVGQVGGVRLDELVAHLPGRAANGDRAFAEVVRLARTLPADPTVDLDSYLEAWAPMIDAVVAAARGDQQATQIVIPQLEELAQQPPWAALATVLYSILAGRRGEQLLRGLDPIDTAITTRVLERLTSQ
jgi:tetratricopeptide (TPR) repeat protein